jgi:histidinol-phosphate aminotransferase
MSGQGVLGRVRDEIRAMKAYKVPPSPPPLVLDANESPWPLPDEARRRIAEAVAAIEFQRYPEIEAHALRAALARRAQGRPDELVIGIGSDEVIGVLCTALARPGAKVLVPEPTFSMFAHSARVAGLTPVGVPLDADFRLDVPAMEAAIEKERPALCFLATPNNPTGNAHSDDALEAIVRAMPDGLVVIDEAYAPFSGRSLAHWVDRFENVGVMGTLSKIGLAAARIGWIRVRPELALELDKVRLPYDLPAPTQVIGALALGELGGVMDAHVAAIVAERARLGAALAARGMRVHPSDANFFLVSHARAGEIHEGLEARGVRVRAFGAHPRLGSHLRVTVGTPAQDDALLAALDATLATLGV